MNIKKVIRERIRRNLSGVDLDADVNAVVAANVGERGQTTRVSRTSTARAGSTRTAGHERRDVSR